LGTFWSELNFRAYRQWIEKPKRFIDSYIVFYKNPEFEDCRFENNDNTRPRQTAREMWNHHLEYWLHYWIILSLGNIEVLYIASPKWVYMLKSAEKWLCKTRMYKTVVGGAILNYSSILKFGKKVTCTIFSFMNWCFQIQSFNWFRLTGLWNIRVWWPSWISPPFWSVFLKIHNTSVLWSRVSKYVIRSTLKLIAPEMTIAFLLIKM
jgi:hypothetical protein